MAKPMVYDLRNDADAKRFGYTPAERDKFMTGCFKNRNGAKPRAIFCHVQEGTTVNSLDWAINKPGGQNSYSYTAQLDGTILACIPEKDGPWTNGAVRSPKPHSKKLRDLGGNPNLYTISIEAEGYWNKPHPQVQIDAIYWLVNDISKRNNIPILGDNSAGDWLFEHADVDNEQRSNCAGPYYDVIQKMVREGGVVEPPVTYAKVQPIKELDAIGASEGFAPAYLKVGGTTWYWVSDRVRAKVDTPRLQYGYKGSPSVGPDIKKGEEVAVDWIAKGEDVYVYYTPVGERIIVDDTERVSDVQEAA